MKEEVGPLGGTAGRWRDLSAALPIIGREPCLTWGSRGGYGGGGGAVSGVQEGEVW